MSLPLQYGNINCNLASFGTWEAPREYGTSFGRNIDNSLAPRGLMGCCLYMGRKSRASAQKLWAWKDVVAKVSGMRKEPWPRVKSHCGSGPEISFDVHEAFRSIRVHDAANIREPSPDLDTFQKQHQAYKLARPRGLSCQKRLPLRAGIEKPDEQKEEKNSPSSSPPPTPRARRERRRRRGEVLGGGGVDEMKVSVKTLKGSSFEIQVEPTSKVSVARHLICRHALGRWIDWRAVSRD
jgi:hypothetical protein